MPQLSSKKLGKNMARLRPLKDNIIFQFKDGHTIVRNKMLFEERSGPIVVPFMKERSVKSPRWGTVRAVGPEVDADIKVGSNILIEPLMWTNGVRLNGELHWRTNAKCVMAIEV